jgi:hypothetical protein
VQRHQHRIGKIWRQSASKLGERLHPSGRSTYRYHIERRVFACFRVNHPVWTTRSAEQATRAGYQTEYGLFRHPTGAMGVLRVEVPPVGHR